MRTCFFSQFCYNLSMNRKVKTLKRKIAILESKLYKRSIVQDLHTIESIRLLSYKIAVLSK